MQTNEQASSKDLEQPQLILHRIYVKSSLFECSAAKTLESFQTPVYPIIEMQVFANAYDRGDNLHEAVLGLKINAKHAGNLIWRIELEQAGFYALERFSLELKNDVLNGHAMNQLYSHAEAVVTQMVINGGFLPIYLQPMDFGRLYQEKKKQDVEAAQQEASDTNMLGESLKKAQAASATWGEPIATH